MKYRSWRESMMRELPIGGTSVLERRRHYSPDYIFQMARGSLVWGSAADGKHTGDNDDRDGTAPGGREGGRNDPYGDGSDLRHDSGAARRRCHQGGAACRRQDPQPWRDGNFVLSAVQSRQAQRRARRSEEQTSE